MIQSTRSTSAKSSRTQDIVAKSISLADPTSRGILNISTKTSQLTPMLVNLNAVSLTEMVYLSMLMAQSAKANGARALCTVRA